MSLRAVDEAAPQRTRHVLDPATDPLLPIYTCSNSGSMLAAAKVDAREEDRGPPFIGKTNQHLGRLLTTSDPPFATDTTHR